MTENPYVTQRNRYLPARLRLVFIFESPPAGHGYFYDDTGRSSELLYRTMTELLLGTRPSPKPEGLRQFAAAGYLIVDPVYFPVNKLPEKEADRLILDNVPNLIEDLHSLGADRAPIVLVKKNICQLLEMPLKEAGFRVLNEGQSIPFPMHYHLPAFSQIVSELVTKSGIPLPAHP